MLRMTNTIRLVDWVKLLIKGLKKVDKDGLWCIIKLEKTKKGKENMIRRAEERDIYYINKLLYQVLEVHHKGRPDLFKSNAKKYTDEQLKEIIHDDNSPIFVFDDDGEIKGYVFCMILQTQNHNIFVDRKTLYIDDLCVDENCRAQGVGKALYQFAENFAKKIGCYNLTLNVWSCNQNALKFYEMQGLVPQKTNMEKIF